MLSSWKGHIRQKLKFSFSESHLSANLKTLTDLNQDFVTISSFFQNPSKSGEQTPTHILNKKLIDKHRQIGMAAEEAWNFLHGLECDGCEEHWAHLGIGDEKANQDETPSELAKFNMALSCTKSSIDLTRFVMTTKLQGRDAQTHVERLAELKGTLWSILKIDKDSTEMIEKGVGDHHTTQASNSAPDGGHFTRRAHSREGDERPASNLCSFLSHPDFDWVSGSLQVFPACDEGAKGANPKAIRKHSPDALRSTTLSDLLRNFRVDRPRNGLPIPERLSLAKVVTVAYLRFHATRWAKSGWNSKGICFLWNDQDDVIFDLKGLHMPYLQSIVYSTSSSDSSNNSQSPPVLGPNAASMFDLGVLLLELGYSRSWDTMDKVLPTHLSNNDLLSAVLQARTLLENGLFDMGRAYRKIVSKLIECAFNDIYDLDDPNHEAAFLEAVILPLEEEERKLRAFLGPDRP